MISYLIHNGPLRRGEVVRHTCDNPPCVHPAHLLKGTVADNNRDMMDRDRQARGEAQGLSKLTEETVREIRRLYSAGGVSYQQLAERFGVSRENVYLVVRRKTWAHVEIDG